MLHPRMNVHDDPRPGPQWCPTGLTRTQKQRVQRLRALETREKTVEMKRNKLFNPDRPMVPIKIWKEKSIVAEESRAADDMIDDPVDDRNSDGNSENRDRKSVV